MKKKRIYNIARGRIRLGRLGNWGRFRNSTRNRLRDIHILFIDSKVETIRYVEYYSRKETHRLEGERN